MPSSGFRRLTDLPGTAPKAPATQSTTDRVRSFQNQKLPGLSTGTGARVGEQGGSPAQQLINMRTPETGVSLSARRTTDAVRLTNQRLMQMAQAQGQRRRQQQQEMAAAAAQNRAGMYQGRSGVAPVRGAVQPVQGGSRGGPAVSRVQSILGQFPGLRITETHGNRAYDVAHGVPRSPNSFHYDRNNPAVDIAGSPAQLQRLYQQLVAMGGWRQILWQVPGHYDHIHVA